MNRLYAWMSVLLIIAAAAAVILLILSRDEPLDPVLPRGESAGLPAAEKPGVETCEKTAPGKQKAPEPGREAREGAQENETRGCVRGRVVSIDEEAPIPGARIELWAGLPSSWWQAQPGKPLLVAVADGKGRFEIPYRQEYDEVEGTFVVRAAGWGTGFKEVNGLYQEIREEITLAPGCLLTGCVIDQDDRPVVGARVFAFPMDSEIDSLHRRGMPLPLPLPYTVSGGDGRFRLPDVDLGGDPDICALDVEGFLGRAELGDLSDAGRTVNRTIRIQRQGTLLLRLNDPTGSPVTFCWCDLQRKERGGWIDQPHTSDVEEGELVIPNLPVGQYTLLLRPDHFRPEKRNAAVRAGGETRLEVTFRAGLRLGGMVRDAADRAVAGAEIRATPVQQLLPGHDFLFSGKAGKDGRFLLDGLPEGKMNLRVASNRHVPVHVAVAAGTEGLLVNLSGKPVLRGRVRVESGDPVPEQVTVWSLRDKSTGCETCELESDGTFLVMVKYRPREINEGLHGSTPFMDESIGVVVHVKGWPPFPQQTVTIRPGLGVDLGEFSRPPGRTVCGRVNGPSGQPVASASIRLDFEDGRISLAGETKADGRFAVPNVPPRNGMIWVDGGQNLPFLCRPLPPSNEGLLSIRLPRGGRIQGLVEDQAGRPVYNATVHLLHARSGGKPGHHVGFMTTVCTDPEGRFRTRLLPPAVFRLCVCNDNEIPGPEIVVRDGKVSNTRIRIK